MPSCPKGTSFGPASGRGRRAARGPDAPAGCEPSQAEPSRRDALLRTGGAGRRRGRAKVGRAEGEARAPLSVGSQKVPRPARSASYAASMNWTNALAVFGAITGVCSLGWSMWSHRLTGGRIEILGTP